jgi:hypothetical protein
VWSFKLHVSRSSGLFEAQLRIFVLCLSAPAAFVSSIFASNDVQCPLISEELSSATGSSVTAYIIVSASTDAPAEKLEAYHAPAEALEVCRPSCSAPPLPSDSVMQFRRLRSAKEFPCDLNASFARSACFDFAILFAEVIHWAEVTYIVKTFYQSFKQGHHPSEGL